MNRKTGAGWMAVAVAASSWCGLTLATIAPTDAEAVTAELTAESAETRALREAGALLDAIDAMAPLDELMTVRMARLTTLLKGSFAVMPGSVEERAAAFASVIAQRLADNLSPDALSAIQQAVMDAAGPGEAAAAGNTFAVTYLRNRPGTRDTSAASVLDTPPPVAQGYIGQQLPEGLILQGIAGIQQSSS